MSAGASSRRSSDRDGVPGPPRLARVARALGRNTRTRRQALQAVTALVMAGALGRLAPAERALAARQQTATCQATSNALTVVGGNDRLAQTFRAVVAGKLMRVDLFLTGEESTTDDLVVQIATVTRFGKRPTNTILASTIVPSSALPVQTAANFTAKFGPSVAADLVANKTYAIILRRQGSSNLFVPTRTDNPCPDGAVFRSDSGTGAFVALGSGTSDLFFTAFVETS